jgi:hypothetical protein
LLWISCRDLCAACGRPACSGCRPATRTENDDCYHKTVSFVAKSDILEQVAAVLKIPAEAIRNFDEDQAINVISSTFNNNAAVVSNNPIFHPIDKIIQLHEEKIALYERMLKEKDEMLGRLIGGK